MKRKEKKSAADDENKNEPPHSLSSRLPSTLAPNRSPPPHAILVTMMTELDARKPVLR